MVLNTFILSTIVVSTLAFFLSMLFIHSHYVRMIMVILFASVTGSLYVTYGLLTGEPRPYTIESFLRQDFDKFILLKHSFDKDKAIYLWILPKDKVKPLYLGLPWDDELAEKLVKEEQRQRETNEPTRMEREDLEKQRQSGGGGEGTPQYLIVKPEI